MKQLLSLILVVALVGCAQLPDNSQAKQSFVIDPNRSGRLQIAASALLPADTTQSAFIPLADGLEAFAKRVKLVDSADHSLDIQYYIWHSDLTGLVLIKRVLDAADRGVRVRILLDDIDTSGRELGLETLNHHPMIEIRVFNPIAGSSFQTLNALMDFNRVNHRMHNKSLTADGTAVILGGRNIGNEYFSAEAESSFADFDVLVVGPVLEQSNRNFDRYWNSAHSYPLSLLFHSTRDLSSELNSLRTQLLVNEQQANSTHYMQAVRNMNALHDDLSQDTNLLWGNTYLLSDLPTKLDANEITPETHLALQLHELISRAQSQVLIISPYFVPTDPMMSFFESLISRGVQVRVLTNSLSASDVSIVHAGYMNHRKRLLELGVEVYEYRSNADAENGRSAWYESSRASLHAKTITIDTRYVFVGSFNVDPRSIFLNTEMGVLIDNSNLAHGFEDVLGDELIHRAYEVTLEDGELRWRTIVDGQEQTYHHEPDVSFWQRMSAEVLSWIVVEGWL